MNKGQTMLATHAEAFVETVKDHDETIAAVRCERIRTARRRIAEGWYDRDDLLDVVVETILGDTQFK